MKVLDRQFTVKKDHITKVFTVQSGFGQSLVAVDGDVFSFFLSFMLDFFFFFFGGGSFF